MRLLLDTVALLTLNSEGLEGLGSGSREVVANPDNELLLSSVSMTELAVKASIGKLNLSAEGIEQILQDLQVTRVSYRTVHAKVLFRLPLHHRDPFDRMLIATALHEQWPLVSPDREFRRYQGLQWIW